MGVEKQPESPASPDAYEQQEHWYQEPESEPLEWGESPDEIMVQDDSDSCRCSSCCGCDMCTEIEEWRTPSPDVKRFRLDDLTTAAPRTPPAQLTPSPPPQPPSPLLLEYQQQYYFELPAPTLPLTLSPVSVTVKLGNRRCQLIYSDNVTVNM